MPTEKRASIAPLPFGIPQLDHLLGYPDMRSIQDERPGSIATSVAIVGPDGTGKSVFALHLVSTYLALHSKTSQGDASRPELGAVRAADGAPFVAYVSSDLRFTAAQRIWHNFYLDHPWMRHVPFLPLADIEHRRELLQPGQQPMRIALTECSPGSTDLRTRLYKQTDEIRASFIDLATNTTGDDWLFVARLLAALPRTGTVPNLLVLDSVAGFETMVGNRNSYGERMSRRARVAQLMRAGGTNWHIVFVVEEPSPGDHHPEEYVTDTVLHLRRYGQGEFTRRTLEIEKSRARSFGIGEHPFEIRDGRGSSTGSWENPDDPHTVLHPRHLKNVEALAVGPGEHPPDRRPYNAYVQVFPSLHFLSREFARTLVLGSQANQARSPAELARADASQSRPAECIPFNIAYLDNMLLRDAQHRFGLPGGSTTALIGDEGTRKSTIAEHFLVQAFADFPGMLETLLVAVRDFKALQADERRKGGALRIDQFLTDRAKTGDSRLWSQIRRHANLYPHRREELSELQDNVWSLLDDAQLEDKLSAQGRPLMTRWDAIATYYARKPTTPLLHSLLLAMSIMRMSWGLLPSTVFVSTHDVSADKISTTVLRTHGSALNAILEKHCDVKPDTTDHRTAIAALNRLVQRFILVRRIELVDATAPQLWHIIHSCVTQALYLLGNHIDRIHEPTAVHSGAASARVVISDLRLIRDTYPAVANDPLFLPTLAFRLKRLGVTTLIIDSDNGRPDQLPTHRMNGALRSLVDHQIYTWKVPFFGEQRVAIGVIPAMNPDARGLVREVTYSRSGVDFLDVDPHFELYTGLEEGRPSAVPLQILLYEETPAFSRYVEAQQGFLSRVFAASPGADRVVEVLGTRDYEGLRDYCHLGVTTHLHHTLVFMIDGFWAAGRAQGSLRTQYDYLCRDLGPRDDPFGLFGETARSAGTTRRTRRVDFFEQRGFYRNDLNGAAVVDRVPFMWDFGFLMCNEHQWNVSAAIPLLPRNVNGKASQQTVGCVWRRMKRIAAFEIPPDDPVSNVPTPLDRPGSRTRTLDVKAIVGEPEMLEGDRERNVTWREFLEAATAVADAERRSIGKAIPAFDLAMVIPQSLVCWMMEVWFSEIHDDALLARRHAAELEASQGASDEDKELAARARAWANDALAKLCEFSQAGGQTPRTSLQDLLNGGDGQAVAAGVGAHVARWRGMDGVQLQDARCDVAREFLRSRMGIPGYALQLYMTWLLMLEVIDFANYQDVEEPFSLRRDMQAEPAAIATRHWYKTACAGSGGSPQHKGSDPSRTKVPCRLPGSYSVRGDWFLGVAKGSRSSRLADQALDMLTSRRANRTRLHYGMGLPTRDLSDGEAVREIRTALDIATPEAIHHIKYGHLLEMGASFEPPTRADLGKANSYCWLFRTAFAHYDRQAISIQRWLHRMLSWTIRYRDLNRATWRDRTGFITYDELKDGDFANAKEFSSLNEFAEGLDVFVVDLESAVPRTR